ncbi:MAG TPA: hypothetical protein ENI85_16555, partial [Deltaproteobacteria bacterium]|nr:hypothetical protein [Deltaproteobacteria bacterium]
MEAVGRFDRPVGFPIVGGHVAAQAGGSLATIEFFYDYGSPYSYLADSRLPDFVARTRAEVLYRPMLLGGVFKATGNRSPFADPVEARRVYL